MSNRKYIFGFLFLFLSSYIQAGFFDSPTDLCKKEWGNTPKCESIGGRVTAKYTGSGRKTKRVCDCYCDLYDDYINVNDPLAKQKCLKGFVEDVVKIFESNIEEGLYNPLCRDGNQIYSKGSNSNLKCPRWMNQKLKDNRESGLFGIVGSPNYICNTPEKEGEEFLRTNFFDGPESLENYLSSHPATAIPGVDPGHISSCVSSGYTTGGSGRTPKKTVTYHQEERKAIVADWYYSMKRLNTGTIGTIESIASIDSILLKDVSSSESKLLPKDKFWSKGTDNSCVVAHLPQASARCEQLKTSCKPQGGLGKLVIETEGALKQRDELREQMKQIKYPRGRRKSDDPQVLAAKAAKKEIEQKIQLVENLYPMIKGAEFEDYAEDGKASKKQIREGIVRQLVANREKLVEKLDNNRKASKCLNSYQYDSDACDEIDNIIAANPESPRINFNDEEEKQAKLGSLFAQGELDDAKCLRQAKGIRDGADAALKDFAINAGVTIATAGLGSVVAGARAATSVVQGASKLAKAGQVVKNIGAGFRGTAGLARASMIGVDLYYGSDSIRAASAACDHMLVNAEQRQEENFSCPQSPSSSMPTAISDWKMCVLAVGTGSLQLIPYMTPLAAKAAKRAIQNKPNAQAFLKNTGEKIAEIAGGSKTVEVLTRQRSFKNLKGVTPEQKLSSLVSEIDSLPVSEQLKTLEDAAASNPLWKKSKIFNDRIEFLKQRELPFEHATSGAYRNVRNGKEATEAAINKIKGQEGLAKGLAENKSIAHQDDLLDFIENKEVMDELRKVGFDKDSFIRGVVDSDMGKLKAYKELLTVDDPQGKSRALYDFLQGKGPKEAVEVLDEIFKGAGLEGKYLLNPDIPPEKLRELFKNAGAIQGYLHELPGMADAVMLFNSGKLTREEFKKQLTANLFHNGPDTGFWKYVLGDQFVAGTMKNSDDQALRSFFKGTAFEGQTVDGVTMARYPSPISVEGTMHSLMDRMSQGTRGGVDKIFEEVPGNHIGRMASLLRNNPEGTLAQLQMLKDVTAKNPNLTQAQKDVADKIISNAQKRLETYNTNIDSVIKVSKNADGEEVMSVLKKNAQGEDVTVNYISDDVNPRVETVKDGKVVLTRSYAGKVDEFGVDVKEDVINILKQEEVLNGDPMRAISADINNPPPENLLKLQVENKDVLRKGTPIQTNITPNSSASVALYADDIAQGKPISQGQVLRFTREDGSVLKVVGQKPSSSSFLVSYSDDEILDQLSKLGIKDIEKFDWKKHGAFLTDEQRIWLFEKQAGMKFSPANRQILLDAHEIGYMGKLTPAQIKEKAEKIKFVLAMNGINDPKKVKSLTRWGMEQGVFGKTKASEIVTPAGEVSKFADDFSQNTLFSNHRADVDKMLESGKLDKAKAKEVFEDLNEADWSDFATDIKAKKYKNEQNLKAINEFYESTLPTSKNGSTTAEVVIPKESYQRGAEVRSVKLLDGKTDVKHGYEFSIVDEDSSSVIVKAIGANGTNEYVVRNSNLRSKIEGIITQQYRLDNAAILRLKNPGALERTMENSFKPKIAEELRSTLVNDVKGHATHAISLSDNAESAVDSLREVARKSGTNVDDTAMFNNLKIVRDLFDSIKKGK